MSITPVSTGDSVTPAQILEQLQNRGPELERELAVMDLTAIVLCKENDLPLVVFDSSESRSLTRIAAGDHVGTRVGAT